MSKGTNRTTVRIPHEMEVEIQALIKRSEFTRNEGPHTITSVILSAIKEKLRHMERSRKSRKRRKSKNDFQACEECLRHVGEIGEDYPGSVTYCPDGSVVVICWQCLVNVGPFAPNEKLDDGDS